MTATLDMQQAAFSAIRDLSEYASTGDLVVLSRVRSNIKNLMARGDSDVVADALWNITLRIQRASIEEDMREEQGE